MIPRPRKATFLCREIAIAILKLHRPYIIEFTVFAMPFVSILSTAQKKSIDYCTTSIHGLPWTSKQTDRILYPQQYLVIVMRKWFDLVKHTSRKRHPTVAYKGGHFESDLLEALQISSANLECWECPKVEILAEQFHKCSAMRYICNPVNHAELRETVVTPHCPKYEVALFEEFVASRWQNQRQRPRRRRNAQAKLRQIKRRKTRDQQSDYVLKDDILDDW